MIKIIIALLLCCIFLTSCISGSETHQKDSKENNTLISQLLQWPVEIKRINWDTDIEFSFCDNKFNYDESSQISFNQTENVKLLESKTGEDFPLFISEYCTNQTADKFIFSASDKQPEKIWRYDKNLDIFEEVEFKSFVFPWISHFWYSHRSRNYWDISLEKYYEEYSQEKIVSRGFWKKEWNIIPFINYWVSIIWHAEVWQAYVFKFLDKKNIDYCNGWITPGWKLSVCFADVYYRYDYIENIIYEDKICSYYIDDFWNTQVLEKCFENRWNKKWYDFTFKYDWVEIYQSSEKDISIIDIDLNKAGIIFWWVRDIHTEYKEEWYWFIENREWWEKEIYNLVWETQSSISDRFERKKAKEILWGYSYIHKDGQRFPIVTAINWQFFNANKNPTFLSFPVKSNWKIISSYVDNDKLKKTFIINNDETAEIKNWYDAQDLKNTEYEELIVWIDPTEDFCKNMKWARNYVWIIGNKNIVFILAQDKRQWEMDTIMKNYGIENYMMLDWWPSAQFSYYDIYSAGSFIHDFYWNWWVPQYNFIYTK